MTTSFAPHCVSARPDLFPCGPSLGWGRILPLLLLLMAPYAPALAQDVDFRSRADGLAFNRFAVRLLPDAAEGEGMGRLQVSQAGQPVYTGEPVRLEPPEATLRLNMPQEGLATLLVTTFSGGAHCCFETCLLTVGQGREECARVALEHGPPPQMTADGNLVVLDWQFAYYE